MGGMALQVDDEPGQQENEAERGPEIPHEKAVAPEEIHCGESMLARTACCDVPNKMVQPSPRAGSRGVTPVLPEDQSGAEERRDRNADQSSQTSRPEHA